MSKFVLAQTKKLETLLELKGKGIKGFGKPRSHPWVPFIVDFSVMTMVYSVKNTCSRLMFCFGCGGGGHMDILSDNPWGFEKELQIM